MRGTGFLVLSAVCALSACGAPMDDADNIPLSGKWLDEGKMMSVSVGGTPADPAEISGIEALKAKFKPREFCGEPRFLTKEAFQEQIEESNPAQCTVDSVDATGSSVLAKGRCNAKEIAGGFEGSAFFKGESKQQPDKVVFDMTINAVVTDTETGEGEMVTLEARRTMTRLGDC